MHPWPVGQVPAISHPTPVRRLGSAPASARAGAQRTSAPASESSSPLGPSNGAVAQLPTRNAGVAPGAQARSHTPSERAVEGKRVWCDRASHRTGRWFLPWRVACGARVRGTEGGLVGCVGDLVRVLPQLCPGLPACLTNQCVLA